MVKRQKEKQYQSAREHRANAQRRAGTVVGGNFGSIKRRLPFHCCALTLTPFEHPVCCLLKQESPASYGVIFENEALLPFLLKHKVDPVTGNPMTSRDIITLTIDKDEEGRWQCPVLTKPLSDHIKIVAIRQPGTNEANVYSYEAYHELNVKTKNYEDLVSGAKFNKKRDVIVLNDINDEALNRLRDINNFHHIRTARTEDRSRSEDNNVKHSVTATRILEKIQQQQQANKKREAGTAGTVANDNVVPKKLKIFSDTVTGVRMTSGKASGSFTSTVMDVSHDDDLQEASQEELLTFQFVVMRKRRKKGYVTLHTTLGNIGLELHCDIVPRTCTNFLGLAEQGKYDGTKFHRLVPNFMVQGGKGEPDESIWGEPFADEFDDRLKHSGPGMVAMANSGPRTNQRQFYLTFKSCNHLDRKHTVFGRVVEGLDVLQAMERVPTDKKDRPTSELKITSVDVLVNPAKEAEETERQRIYERAEAQAAEKLFRKSAALGRTLQAVGSGPMVIPSADVKPSVPGVGKYLSKVAVQASSSNSAVSKVDESEHDPAKIPKASRLPPPPKKTTFGNFSGW